jgi:hypothetical protein
MLSVVPTQAHRGEAEASRTPITFLRSPSEGGLPRAFRMRRE